MQKAIVTGGAGFIGSHLTELLAEKGIRVTVIDNFSTGRRENLKDLDLKSNIEIIDADITDIDAIEPFFADSKWVFHLAALADIVPSIEDPLKYHRNNVDGTVNVLEAARKHGVEKLVYAASSSCYGDSPTIPTGEDSPADPRYPYALTKYVAEQYILHWSEIYGIPAVSLRLFNVYGPRSRTAGTYGAVLGVFIAQKLAGKPFTIVGDGEQKRDFVYVRDVAEAFYKAASSGARREIFNIGAGDPESVNTLAGLLGGEKVNIPERPGEPEVTHADITKIRDMIGWQPIVKFSEGISLCLEQIEYWKDAPVWTPEGIEEKTRSWFKYLSK